MAAQQPRPGVEVIQEFQSTSPTIVIPTLVPCNVAPFFEIIEVLNSDGTLNEDSELDTPYAQFGLTVSQGSFPSPRGNIDQVDVDEDSIRVFLAHGGSLLELSRTSGFLADMNVATQPTLDGTGTATFDLANKKLVVALDAHTAVGADLPTVGDIPSTANVTIEFSSDAMTLAEVVAEINAVVPNLASDNGSGNLRLTSPSYGAGASVLVRFSGSANSELGFSVTEDEDDVAVGAGFYAIDDADGDQVSPRLEIHTGTTKRALNGSDVPVFAVPATYFTDKNIEAGDRIVAGGVDVGEVVQVFAQRLVIAVEQNIFGTDTPFAPRYVWAQANNLSFPAPAASTAAAQTGTRAASPATSAYIVGDSAFSAVGAGESFDIDVVVAGVAQATEVIGTGAGWADLTAAVTSINGQATNFEAYPANDVGDEVATAIGTHLGLRTKSTNQGSDSAITMSDITVLGQACGFTTTPVSDIGENIRYPNGLPAIITGGSAWGSGGGGWTGGAASITFTVDVNGVGPKGPESLDLTAFTDDIAGLDAAVAEWNAESLWTEAYRSDAAGVEDAAGTYLSIRTRGENVGLDAEIDLTGGTDVAKLGGVATHNGIDSELNGANFKWQVDGNPKTYDILFATDEDDGGVSLQQVIDGINAETPGVASASSASPPSLVLTSGMVGEGSKITVVDGTANDIASSGTAGLGFTDNTTVTGDGRPLPDLAIDISGNALIQNQILRNGLTGAPFSGGGAPIHIAYTGLRLDLSPDADDPALVVFNDTDQLESIADPISTDNPGALMAFLTLINSPGTAVAAIGVPEVSADAPDGTPIGYAKCFSFLESEEVYALSLGTQSSVVHQAGLTHVSFMSEPAQKGERILFFNPVLPSRRVNTLLGSGTDANTTPTTGKLTIEENIAPALIAQGIDPDEVNPTSGAITNEVFLDLGGDDNYYLVQKVENGTDVFIRTSFVSGDGNEDAFYATTAPAGVISDDWTVAIRGTELLLADGSPDKDGIAETLQTTGQAYGNRRGFYVYPDQVGINVTGLEQVVEGYYAASCIVGMVASLPPQQGFTNYPITGLTQVLNSSGFLSNTQLNVVAAGGIYILVQDADSAPVICRHQLSTDMTSIETRELSITKVVDFTAKFLRAGLRNFIGRSNITQSFLDQLSSVVQGIMSFLIESGVLIGADVNNVIQDADNPDTVLIDITLDVPYPANYIRITLVV